MATNRDEEEDLQMALRMSLQNSLPEAKRSKPGDFPGVSGGSASVGGEIAEARNRRIQRELMAAAAKKRMEAMGKSKVVEEEAERSRKRDESTKKEGGGNRKAPFESGEEPSLFAVEDLFVMIFGEGVSRDVLAQWCNQGIMSEFKFNQFSVVVFISELLMKQYIGKHAKLAM